MHGIITHARHMLIIHLPPTLDTTYAVPDTGKVCRTQNGNYANAEKKSPEMGDEGYQTEPPALGLTWGECGTRAPEPAIRSGIPWH